ncbi:MAG: alpha-L-fucosidase [Cytophagales bacterium]|nr:alpha-L-fucosidase [Cytophagales bacterium]
MKNKVLTIMIGILVMGNAVAQEEILNLNKPEREAWFTDLGFGMFIHWSHDVQLGMVISHSLVGASADYIKRYERELPKTFDPSGFDPEIWAQMAKSAGMKYVVFTTKHHNGFCMYDTETTDYNIMNTPFGRDVTGEIVEAFRKEGLAIGLYFSPDDFHFINKQGIPISRKRAPTLPSNNPELLDYIREQMKELMTNYGKIDVVFLDGAEQYGKTELAKVCWEINPDVVVTRGAIETPEQNLPDTPIPSPWEACYTSSAQWQYRPTNEVYKSAGKVIEMVIEIRAKGGNLLLNFGPDAEGHVPPEQKAILNEVALWMFINRESMEDVEPLATIREDNIWFLKKKDGHAMYAFITGEADWKLGERKEFILKSIEGTGKTKVSVLGHGGSILEYQTDVDASPSAMQTGEGLKLDIMRAQRIYNDRKWPNPIVVKLENVKF